MDQRTKDSEYFIFENISKSIELESAIELAEDGRFILMHFSCKSISSSLHRLFGFYNEFQRIHYLCRFLDSCFLMYSQMEIFSEGQSSASYAGEIVLLNQELKKILLNEGVFSFEGQLKQLDSEIGVVTLNQSLIQLLIRRKISFKTAFELSNDPEELDILLKKVGV